jgi:hypothetical protein
MGAAREGLSGRPEARQWDCGIQHIKNTKANIQTSLETETQRRNTSQPHKALTKTNPKIQGTFGTPMRCFSDPLARAADD